MDTEGLSVICSGLGSFDEDNEGDIKYTKDNYCLDNLKDLLRFLRRDDPETRDVFKQVCKWNIVGKNLIPIIEYFQDDRNLVLNAVKVLVFLTMPIESTSKDVNQQLEYLWGIKSAITSSDVVAVVVSLLEKPLENLECMAFSDDDWKLVQLVLTLFRNILAVQDISLHQKALGSANQLISLRDDFLERLFKENVMDLIIIITQHIGGSCPYLRRDNMLLLEIYHYIFMCQDPELIAKCTDDAKVDEVAKAGLNGLEYIMQEEAAKKRQARLHSSRHSQFGATFTRLTLDGSKTMCKGVPTSASCDKLLKPEKVHRGVSKRVVKDYAQVPTTKRSLLEKLRELLNQFLNGGYNVLMQSVIMDIEKEHDSIQASDVLMFFHLAQFATSFQYHKAVMTKHNAEASTESSLGDTDNDDNSTWFKGDICGPIASTMNESMFALVIAKWQLAFEGLKETKNNAFLSVSGSLMKTMIRMLDLVLKLMPESSKEPQTARTILYKLFYDQTDQGLTQFLVNMVRSFDAHKQPKSDLADLVEIIHVVIRLMEKLQAHGTLRVAKKARKTRRKKKDDVKNKESDTGVHNITIQNDIQCSGNEEPPDGSIPEKETALQTTCAGDDTNVRVSVSNDETETLMTEDQNTDSGLPLNDQGEAPLNDQGEAPLNDQGEAPLNDQGEADQAHENTYDYDSSADEQAAATAEVDFKMTSWLIHLASSTIISNLCWLLKFYKSNSTATNHYLVSLLRRICDDLELAPMLYQLSCLVIFYEILDDQKACPQKEFENLVHFLTSLVRRMLRKMKNQPLLFVDLLFWKSRKDCHYINMESIHSEIGEMRKEVRNWDREDAGPSQSRGGVRKSLADALGDDEYDVMISGEPRHEIDVNLNEDAEVHLETGDNENHTIKGNHGEHNLEGGRSRKRRLVLNGKLEEQIRSLYEKYKDSPGCSELIAADLDANGTISSAQVLRKCKKLGLQLPSRTNVGVGATADIEINLPDANNPDGSFILKKPLHSRKRVRAIDEDMQLKIRSLFEQFKEHKRCSHMIAEQLDPTGTVTAAQVSRKLKKLGLHTSRMRGGAKTQKTNDADACTDSEDDSDNLTLSLLKKRSKNNEDASFSNKETGTAKTMQSPGHSTDDDELVLSSFAKRKNNEDISFSNKEKGKSNTMQSPGHSSDDDELVLSSIAKRKNNEDISFSNKEKGKSNTMQSPGHSSDDDELVLSSIAKKSRRGRSEPEDRQDIDGQDSGEQISRVSDERGNREHSNAMDTNFETPHSEDPASKHDPVKLSAKSPNEFSESMQTEHQYNELEDSEDEQQQPSASPKRAAIRRKLRVMLDFDDDD